MNNGKIIGILSKLEANQRNAAGSAAFGRKEHEEIAQALSEAITKLRTIPEMEV